MGGGEGGYPWISREHKALGLPAWGSMTQGRHWHFCRFLSSVSRTLVTFLGLDQLARKQLGLAHIDSKRLDTSQRAFRGVSESGGRPQSDFRRR